MIKRFSLRKVSAAPAVERETIAQTGPSHFPIQRVPAEIVVEDEVVARFKVDVAAREGQRVVVAGWRVGEVDILVDSDAGPLEAEWHIFPRDDVANHFGLKDGTLVGFALQVDTDARSIRLTWAQPNETEPMQATLAFSDGASLVPEDAKLLGPLHNAFGMAPNVITSGSDAAKIDQIRQSGLVHEEWYLQTYPDLAAAGVDPVAHYFFRGADEGRNPNYLFDTRWYADKYPDVQTSGANPLLHYLQFGEREGRSPSVYFESAFYRYQLGPGEVPNVSLLAHYLLGGWRNHAPNEFFDSSLYIENNPDVRDVGIDPLLHYISRGWQESREINRTFSFEKYKDTLAQRLGRPVEPLRYYLVVGRANGEPLPRHGAERSTEAGKSGLADQLLASQQPGTHFERELISATKLTERARARMFAFYLPQFHPFPENDEWWGKGFTEWSNVTRAIPRFRGHQQPRLPRDLGFYDLRNIETIREQVKLACASGVAGFCFYYYWFDGKRLLDKPLDLFLQSKDINFPFCLMWANENWTRRWDGMESDVLMGQRYLSADDEALVADFARYFADPRYERIDGRPLLFIYRPGIIPDARKRIKKWRSLFRNKHKVNPLIMMAQCFGDDDPRPFGLDGAIEFPPHKLAKDLAPINSELQIFDPGFKGHYLEYDDLVASSRSVEQPPFDLIRTLVPSWDNEARKPGRGMGFVNADPERYEDWLRYLVSWSGEHPIQGEHKYVFVNAWNEWAEGAHLEPDVHNGVAYLNATLRALVGMPRPRRQSTQVLLVGHDAYLHGAQLLTLNIMRTLKESFGIEVVLLLLDGAGPLVEEYRKLGKVFVASESSLPIDIFLDAVTREVPARTAICNTVVTGDIVRHLADRGFNVLSLVHELPRLIKERSLESRARAIAEHAGQIVFAADYVRDAFESIVGSMWGKAHVQPQGIYQEIVRNTAQARVLKDRLDLPAAARVVINIGYGDLRKGFDLFVEVAKQVSRTDRDTHFVWLGHLHDDLQTWLDVDLTSTPLCDRLHILPFDTDVALYLNGADAMALTSREDPFPSTVMEALAAGLPVVAFDGGGGYPEAIRRHAVNGTLVPMADTGAMAGALLGWLGRDDEESKVSRAELATADYNWRDYVFGLLQRLHPELRKVSVVVPNFNYERYLPERLGSIFAQTYPIYELIVLDDASGDDSVQIIQDCLYAAGREARIVVNDQNSGSVFRQWEKGGALAHGDYIWIAEADDGSTPEFLSHLLAEFQEGTTLGFSDSRQVDGEGKHLGDSYDFYYRDLPVNSMRDSFTQEGRVFVTQVLAIKNVILNVSSAIFNRNALMKAFSQSAQHIQQYKMAGDWRLYCELLRQEGSKITYCNKSDNMHRRHATSVTHALAVETHVKEIQMVHAYVDEHFSLSDRDREHVVEYFNNVCLHLQENARR